MPCAIHTGMLHTDRVLMFSWTTDWTDSLFLRADGQPSHSKVPSSLLKASTTGLMTAYGPAYWSPILVFLSSPTEEEDPGNTMKELLRPVTVRPDSGEEQVAS